MKCKELKPAICGKPVCFWNYVWTDGQWLLMLSEKHYIEIFDETDEEDEFN